MINVIGQMDLTSVVESKKGKRNQEGKTKKSKSHVDVCLIATVTITTVTSNEWPNV